MPVFDAWDTFAHEGAICMELGSAGICGVPGSALGALVWASQNETDFCEEGC